MKQLNVFGEPLEECSTDPLTGFTRSGCCDTGSADLGSHTICIQASKEFLEFSRFRGNDLSTPMPDYGFPGLEPGDRWCLCAARWKEAFELEMAPPVYLRATNQKSLDIVSLDELKKFALDLE